MDYELFKKECEKDILNIENVRDISNKKVVYCIDMKIPSIVAFGTYSLINTNTQTEEQEDED